MIFSVKLNKEQKEIRRNGVTAEELDNFIRKNNQEALIFIATNCSVNVPFIGVSKPDGSIRTWPNYEELRKHAFIDTAAREKAIRYVMPVAVLKQLASRDPEARIRKAANERLYEIEGMIIAIKRSAF